MGASRGISLALLALLVVVGLVTLSELHQLAGDSTPRRPAAQTWVVSAEEGVPPWPVLAWDLFAEQQEAQWQSAGALRRPCPEGQFRLQPNTPCEPQLDCAGIEARVTARTRLTAGGVKIIFRAEFRDVPVIFAEGHVHEDFLEGVRNLKALGAASPWVVQPLGACEERHELITPFYEHGSLLDFLARMPEVAPIPTENWALRLQFVGDYLAILDFLHNSPIGTRVICDSNSVEKLMSQILVTNELRLIFNDADAIPAANREAGLLVRCGHRQLTQRHHPAIAPEQEWPYADRPFRDQDMPGYDEKIDIWRVPEVVATLLQVDGALSQSIQRSRASIYNWLAAVGASCRSANPRDRPTARTLYHEWLRLMWAQSTPLLHE